MISYRYELMHIDVIVYIPMHVTVICLYVCMYTCRNGCNNYSMCAAQFMISLSSCNSKIKIIGLHRNYARAQQITHMHMYATHISICMYAGKDNYNCR